MQPFNQFAHLVTESTPQLTVAEQFNLDMAATRLAMSGLLVEPTATPDATEEPEEHEETYQQDEDSKPTYERPNPKTVGRSTVKRKNNSKTARS